VAPATAFAICTLSVVPAWLLLVVAPRWRWTDRLVQTAPIFVVLCAVYMITRIVRPELPEGAGLTSLEAVMVVLSSPYGVLVTWIHILVIDLFVGAWMVRDARRRSVAHAVVVPCLVVAFVAAPLGLLSYLAVRAFADGTVSLGEPLGAD
jgi:hypothetical protein